MDMVAQDEAHKSDLQVDIATEIQGQDLSGPPLQLSSLENNPIPKTIVPTSNS
jgi:hypothetical protein